MWASAKHVGDFVKQNLSSFSCVDLSPYNAPKQNWRCVGSSKRSDPARVLQPTSKTNFLKCIVQQDCTGSVIVGCRESLKAPVGLSGAAQKIINQFSNVRQGAAHFSTASDRFLIVPFLSQVCPIAKREHRSNHQYAVVDLKCMRWKHCCHNEVCKQKIQIWQPMPDFRCAKLLMPPCAPVRIASQIDESCAVADLVVRARGPPPTSAFTNQIRYIRCSNGLFCLPNT